MPSSWWELPGWWRNGETSGGRCADRRLRKRSTGWIGRNFVNVLFVRELIVNERCVFVTNKLL